MKFLTINAALPIVRLQLLTTKKLMHHASTTKKKRDVQMLATKISFKAALTSYSTKTRVNKVCKPPSPDFSSSISTLHFLM